MFVYGVLGLVACWWFMDWIAFCGVVGVCGLGCLVLLVVI